MARPSACSSAPPSIRKSLLRKAEIGDICPLFLDTLILRLL